MRRFASPTHPMSPTTPSAQVRLCSRVPTPHWAVHSVLCQTLHEGQVPVLHNSKSDASPGHWSATSQVRVRTLVPPPHVTEQAPNAVHAFQVKTTGATGHASSPQTTASTKSPSHPSSPASPLRHSRLRSEVPPPQVAEHEDQMDHTPHATQAWSLQLIV